MQVRETLWCFLFWIRRSRIGGLGNGQNAYLNLSVKTIKLLRMVPWRNY